MIPDRTGPIYFLQSPDELLVGPFQGKPACVRIAVGKGVCGAAVEQARSIVVEDVHDFPGHIACDAASRSELVVPLIRDGCSVFLTSIVPDPADSILTISSAWRGWRRSTLPQVPSRNENPACGHHP